MTAPTDPAVSGAEVDLTGPEVLRDPHGFFGRLREETPIARGHFRQTGFMWLVTRYGDVRTVLNDPRFVHNSRSVPGMTANVRAQRLQAIGVAAELLPYVSESLQDIDAPDHTRLRKLASRAFTVRRVNALRPRVEALTAELLDALPEKAGGGVVDLVEGFAYPLPITVICELVGIPPADRERWRTWTRTILTKPPQESNASFKETISYLHELIGERRRTPTGDLLSELIRTRDEGGDRLGDSELIGLVMSLVFAGHDSTTHLIANAVATLLTHPDQLALLRADPALALPTVHETQRWCGPVLYTRPRYVMEDLTLCGVRIARGESVLPLFASANNDPRRFEDPDRFDITRETPGRGEAHVGFGFGGHYCLGAALARQEVEVAIGALLQRHPGLALGVPEDELPWTTLSNMRRLEKLPILL
ncbi:cytochrome P450 [Actinomadura cremea]|nr:cytochrome P450 [Actinomadura cremea]